MRAGFPHSDIPGSKLVCQLPGAYRRLLRPSSPVIAKASTTCTYSLDPITLSPRTLDSKPRATGELVFAAFEVLLCPSNATIQSNPSRFTAIPRAEQHPRFTTNQDLYFFRFVKERYSRSTQGVECSTLTTSQRSTFNSGVEMVEVNGIEPMTSCLQSRRSPN